MIRNSFTLTDLKQQVKRADRYSIYVDGKYSFSLSEHELMLQGLRIGQEFSKQQLADIRNTAAEDKVYMQAVDLIARRPRSVWEMKRYLKRKGNDDNTIDKILSKLSNRELLNDCEFARSWVSNRRLLKNVSKRRLMQELQQKRISSDIISKVLSEDSISDTKVIKELIRKKRQQSRYEDDTRLFAYLVRQGFNYDDVRQALRAED